MKKDITTFEAYRAGFPKETREKLDIMRKLIQLHAPEALESISYGMPAYKIKGKPLVYFGAFAKHIGFYATPTGHQEFKERLAEYKHGKGSVQFPLNEPLPEELIAEIIQFRMTNFNA